jgi:hypothetical protein
MNWLQIQEDYPKAWGELLKWIDADIEVETLEILRDLYDFFDSYKIVVETKWNIGTFQGSVWVRATIYYTLSDPDRTAVEEASFLKAFSILEEKLTIEQNFL